MMSRKVVLLLITSFFLQTILWAQAKVKTYHLADYGILPNTKQNISPAFVKALSSIRNKTKKGERIIVQFQKGTYNFYPEGAVERNYYISNHDQVNPKMVGIEIANFNQLTLDGRGAELLFHGRMLPLALIENSDIKIKNLSIDFDKPQITQIKVVENDTIAGSITFETAPWVAYQIKDSVFYNTGLGWQMQPTSGIAFEEKTKRILYKSGDISVGTKGVSEIAPGKIKAHRWKNNKLLPGTVIAMRSWYRPSPGIFLHKGKNVSFENVKVHYAEGMGLLAQLSENIYMDGLSVSLKGKDDPRYFTTQADATHFSGCKGVIEAKNGLYEGMMDDAINVHGTYLKAIKKLNDHTLLASYMHGQSYGFDWGYKGDTVQFIQSKTMEIFDRENTIQSITPVRANAENPLKQFEIVFTKPLDKATDPSQMDIGIENLTWTPKVIFTKNVIRNNRARGALFSTPKTTIVTKNLFDHTSGSAIVLCGDSNGWYETGACRDVTIKDNQFVNALTSMYQFTNAVISIYPEIPNLKAQKKYFHAGIKIENNRFDTFDKPILYAKSVDGLAFRHNQITTNQHYPSFHKNQKRILFDRVVTIDFSNNFVDGKLVDLLAQ